MTDAELWQAILDRQVPSRRLLTARCPERGCGRRVFEVVTTPAGPMFVTSGELTHIDPTTTELPGWWRDDLEDAVPRQLVERPGRARAGVTTWWVDLLNGDGPVTRPPTLHGWCPRHGPWEMTRDLLRGWAARAQRAAKAITLPPRVLTKAPKPVAAGVSVDPRTHPQIAQRFVVQETPEDESPS